MKKYLFILIALLISGCGCVLTQVPPQTIQADVNCQALLPDYTKIVLAFDHCNRPLTKQQSPLPGTLLTINNPAITVTITAKNDLGIMSEPMYISVLLIDTVKPILSWPVGQLNMTEQDVINLYKNWEAAVKVHGIAKWMYDQKWTGGMAFADTTRIENELHFFTNIITLTDEEYAQYVTFVEGNH
jgi:hypothetical protein